MPWQVLLPDESWASTDDLTVAELEAVEKAADTPWSILNPLRSIPAYRALVGAFCIRKGMPDEETKKWFEARTQSQMLEGVKWVDTDDLPTTFEDGIPKAEDDTSTNGSVGDGNTSDSLPMSSDDKPSVTSNS